MASIRRRFYAAKMGHPPGDAITRVITIGGAAAPFRAEQGAINGDLERRRRVADEIERDYDMVVEAIGRSTHDLRRAIAAPEQAEAVDIAGAGLRESAPQWRDENRRRVVRRAHSSR